MLIGWKRREERYWKREQPVPRSGGGLSGLFREQPGGQSEWSRGRDRMEVRAEE